MINPSLKTRLAGALRFSKNNFSEIVLITMLLMYGFGSSPEVELGVAVAVAALLLCCKAQLRIPIILAGSAWLFLTFWLLLALLSEVAKCPPRMMALMLPVGLLICALNFFSAYRLLRKWGGRVKQKPMPV